MKKLSEKEEMAYRTIARLEARVAVLQSALEGMVEYFPEGHSDGECFSVETAKAALAEQVTKP